MNLTPEKLTHLWRSYRQIIAEHTDLKNRADGIYRIVEGWETPADKEVILAISDKYGLAENAGIPQQGWPLVRERLESFYTTRAELKPHARQVDEVTRFLHIERRQEELRLCSNRRLQEDSETSNTVPNPSNPESFLASYHFPFEIIQFLFSCQEQEHGPDFDLLRGKEPRLQGRDRFIIKFIWMVARRKEVLPIFSLRSFQNLAPVFQQLNGSMSWGGREGDWKLSFEDFTAAWPEIVATLSQAVTGGEPYSELPAAEQRALATFLFVVSLSDTAAKVKNALAMLQTGNRAMILLGPPGTGKTFSAKAVARQLFAARATSPDDDAPNITLEDHRFSRHFPDPEYPATDKPAKLSHGCWEIVQFHPAYAYQDFIGGIVPDVRKEEVKYRLREGIFKRFCDAAARHPDYSFVLIIDEINRANVSGVFGELLYALEYRGEAVDVPYFGPFLVPANVFLIGTMNTLDKNLDGFDLALRRRFLFMKHRPDMSALQDWNSARIAKDPKSGIDPAEVDDLAVRADRLNQRLTAASGLNLPEDYGIGQAYFMKILDFCAEEADRPRRITEFSREQLWIYHLEPLIEEYLGAEAPTYKEEVAKIRAAFVTEETQV